MFFISKGHTEFILKNIRKVYTVSMLRFYKLSFENKKFEPRFSQLNKKKE